ncbi:ASCH domain-containing protein [Lentilactobacillus sp. Marseille-Q4993]|uniref:ASCH domain-containing protein n=1 Tax=Lentilactobacillus sp. Marseille-Q4993 TaxID=3039492 RepID=UPI0024BC848B|nr:ASCH domain-containing protein [Lentilactobacillus sp. Marseille-Q4993]
MKALSIRADYANEIFMGDKVEEYRSWKTDYRGPLLVCTTQRKIKGTIPGHAFVIVNLYDIEKLGDRDYAWQIEVEDFIEPFPVKGKLHLYDVDDSLIHIHKELRPENKPNQATFDKYFDKYIQPLIY